jgi:hypothetical protein
MSTEPERSAPRPAVMAIASVVLLIGAVTLVGSLVGSQTAAGWLEGRPVVVPLTALAVIGTGLALAAVGARRAWLVLAAVVAASLPILVGVGANRGWWDVPRWLQPDGLLGAPNLEGAPATSSIVLLTLVGAALLLLAARQVVASQLLAVVPAVCAYASLAAYMLGDRSYVIERSSFPQTHTALPTAVVLLLCSIGLVVAAPDRAAWAWLNEPGPGRWAFRRAAVPLVLSPLGAFVVVHALDLDVRFGEPRAHAVVVTLMAMLLVAAVVPAAREVDRLAAEANRREVADTVAAAQADAARRAERIAALAAQLSATSSVRGVVDVIVADAPATLDADFVSFALPDPERSQLSVTRSIDGGVAEPTTEDVRTGEPTPIMDAYRSASPVWITEPTGFDDRYPLVAPLARETRISSMVAMPLVRGVGDPIGALAAGWREGVPVDDALRSMVSTVAQLCTQTIQRAMLTDSEHRLIAGLQDRLVGRPPTLRHLDMDVRYRPAADVGMGGDWYEAIESPDGQVTVVLGDVSGHGVEAVADMARARTLIGSLVRQGSDLGAVLHQVDQLLGREQPVMATVVLVHIDPWAGVVRHTSAGHPPVALRLPDGGVVLAEGSRQPLLGAGLVHGPIEPAEVEFPPGAVAVVYSDGLIERRGEDLDAGLDRLARTLHDAPRGPAHEIADHLLREMLAESEELDDTALVVIRRGMSLVSEAPRDPVPVAERS